MSLFNSNEEYKIKQLQSSLAQSASKLDDIMQYNVTDYVGNSLNEKWDNMRSTFVSYARKNITIPVPKPNQTGAVFHQNEWKWALTAPIIFDDSCNQSTVWLYNELLAASPIPSAIRFDDTSKPEDIDFPLGIRIRGDSLTGKSIGIGLDIRASARLNFIGQVLINDCDYGVIVGGENQSAPASVAFDKLSIGFPKINGVVLNGKTVDVSFYADRVSIGVFQSSDRDAMVITGKVVNCHINSLEYATDVAKNGYVTYDAKNILHIYPSNNFLVRNIRIGDMFSSNSACGLLIDDINSQGTSYAPRNIFINNIRVNPGDTPAFNINNCEYVVIDNIGEFNTALIGATAKQCYLRNRNFLSNKTITNSSNTFYVNNIAKPSGLAVGELPNTSLYPIGTVISNVTANGNKVYLKYQETGVTANDIMQIDSQMFIPNVAVLPSPAWNLRGKMFMVQNDTSGDNVYICLRTDGTYKWFNVVSMTFV
jgi:hypothetical protein